MKLPKNEALALFALILIAPFFGLVYMAMGFAILLLCMGGVDDLLRAAHDLSWTPEYGQTAFFKSLVALMITVSALLSIYTWKKIFYH